MYLSRHKHLLSVPVMLSALVRLTGSVFKVTIRIVVARNNSITPDMSDSFLWYAQTFFSLLEIVVVAAAFGITWKKLIHYNSIIEANDRAEMGRLQEEALGTKLSSLSLEAIGQLFQIWACILIGAETVYLISSMIYRRFISELMQIITDSQHYLIFYSIYNMTHGFKYLSMLMAILLGVMMTAVFLHDRRLEIAVPVIAGLFLLAFGILNMQTVSLIGREIGVVWTSVVFHLTETIGLLGFSIYLAKHYKGL